jgi:hypothetical protein
MAGYGVALNLDPFDEFSLNNSGPDDAEALRQARIALGEENVCCGCGCSDSRSCPGGCVWATRHLCSRCV